jgi:hypothetical protein
MTGIFDTVVDAKVQALLGKRRQTTAGVSYCSHSACC